MPVSAVKGSRTLGGSLAAPVSRSRAVVGRWVRRRWKELCGGLLVVGVLVWLLALSPLVGVREIAVSGVTGASRDAVAQIAAPSHGEPLVKIDTEKIAQDVIALGTVARVDVERHWPTTLVLRVKPRDPVFAMPNTQGKVEVFDAEGIAFWTVDAAPAGVPTVQLASSDDPEQRRTAATVVASLSAAQRARLRGVQVATDQRVTLDLGGVAVTWGGPDQSAVKARIVEILSQRQGLASINVSVPESPVTRDGKAPAPKP